jgi:two-component system OmpR family response regulator/two-component system alkaline phosphatase synthesis response regulator PhoP
MKVSTKDVADLDSPRTVLVVEDEPNIRELVVLHLQLDGWTVTQTGDGQEALRLARAEPFDLIILDLMLPGLDGMTVLRALRREGPGKDVPVLLLTARRDESDKVLGLESGADDYLTKPFGVRELVARARALTRRPRAGAATLAPAGVDVRPVRLGPLVIDPARRSVSVGGREVELTGREFDLLHLLASHPGIVFSREVLVQRVWRGDTFVTARNIDTLVKRLRQKVETNPSEPALILTVWGAGYKAADV